MASLAPLSDDSMARLREPANSPPITRRQSVQAIGLLVIVLLVLFSVALTIGAPAMAGR